MSDGWWHGERKLEERDGAWKEDGRDGATRTEFRKPWKLLLAVASALRRRAVDERALTFGPSKPQPPAGRTYRALGTYVPTYLGTLGIRTAHCVMGMVYSVGQSHYGFCTHERPKALGRR